MSDKAQLEAILKKGADSAEYLAMKTLRKVYKKLGLVPRPR
jgi:tryptophanyl-tRNA synthetase